MRRASFLIVLVLGCDSDGTAAAPAKAENKQAAAPAPSKPREAGADATADAKATDKPMRVTQMAVTGFVRMSTGGKQTEQQLPASPMNSGEFPEAIWATPDGTLYVVGKLYTGKPGPDHGVVYRRAADGKWSIVHTMPDHTFHSIAGKSADDFYIGAMGGVVHSDGKAFNFLKTDYKMVVKVWSEKDGTVVAQAFDGSESHTATAGKLTKAKRREEPDLNRRKLKLGDTEYTVFDRSEEVGERDLDPEEAAEIRGELEQIEKGLKDGSIKARKPSN